MSSSQNNFRAALGAALAVVAGTALTGCIVAPPPGQPVGYYASEPGPVVVASVAPPPLIYEPVVAAPAPGYLWISGYWSWSGGRHVWTGGHWAAPRPGYHWVPRQWERGPGGWQQRGGHWAR